MVLILLLLLIELYQLMLGNRIKTLHHGDDTPLLHILTRRILFLRRILLVGETRYPCAHYRLGSHVSGLLLGLASSGPWLEQILFRYEVASRAVVQTYASDLGSTTMQSIIVPVLRRRLLSYLLVVRQSNAGGWTRTCKLHLIQLILLLSYQLIDELIVQVLVGLVLPLVLSYASLVSSASNWIPNVLSLA